jgi:hypothetical protein
MPLFLCRLLPALLPRLGPAGITQVLRATNLTGMTKVMTLS